MFQLSNECTIIHISLFCLHLVFSLISIILEIISPFPPIIYVKLQLDLLNVASN